VTPEPGLTSERILQTAEDVIRRYGPAKATVVDVARALGVSHGSVYRHFPSKAALRDAVSARWLARITGPLASIADGDGPARDRLRRWFDALIAMKRARALEDPELFTAYSALVSGARETAVAHVAQLTDQVQRIVADGIASGEFEAVDVAGAARAAFDATLRFHKPTHAAEWTDPNIDAAWDGVWNLIARGLEKRS
jgi:AcrR family transcriptional regulator